MDPTRGENILDLVFTSLPIVSETSVVPGMSDHEAVLFSVNSAGYLSQNVTDHSVFLYHKGNFDAIRKDMIDLYNNQLSINPCSKTVEENWQLFKTALLESISKYVPQKVIRNQKKLPWINCDIKRCMKQRKRLYNRAKKTNRDEDWAAYRLARNEVNSKLESAHSSYCRRMFDDSFANNRRQFWKYIKAKRRDSSGISPLLVDGSIISDPQGKAAVLSDQFRSVFTLEDTSNVPNLDGNTFAPMSAISISSRGIQAQLDNLDPNKAQGPDKIAPFVLKNCAAEIAPMLEIIFNQSLNTGVLPSDWLTANICPVFKKGSRNIPSNYRPISLTSSCCKIMEHIIFHAIMEHVQHNNILIDNQHGFRSGHSCQTQLISLVEDLSYAMDSGFQTDVILLDFSKAFDTVPHKRLLNKLQNCKINNFIMTWIKSWLTQRTQCVVVDGISSSSVSVLSGVPQGTVLGPLLFLIYVNDIASGVSSSIRLFADDCILYRTVKCEADSIILQRDLDILSQWSTLWQMKFNVSKCVLICCSRSPNLFQYNYQLYDHILDVRDEHLYLGVLLHKSLSWSNHIAKTSAKASQLFNFLRCNLSNCSPSVKASAYLTIVRPVLEYAASVWDPYQQNDILSLEKVQRRAARWALSDYGTLSSVTNMLEILNWPSLESRRRISRLQTLYKGINNLSGLSIPHYFLPTQRSTRHHHFYHFIQPSTRTNYYQNSFFPKTIKDWNNLPVTIIESENIDIFTNHLL